MKKAILSVILIAGMLVLSSFVLAVPKKDHEVTGLDIAAMKNGQRWAWYEGELVEARIFMKKPSNPGNGNGNGGGNSGGGSTGSSSCYDFIGNGVKWRYTEGYLLDTANNDGLSSGFVSNVISNGFNVWDSEVSFDIFGPEGVGVVDGPDTVSPDGKNEVMFGSISGTGTIAVTIVWGVFNGPPSQRRIVEYDLVFDDPDYNWGDASLNSSLMDFESIAVHELGHAAGLDDLYDNSCFDETMYGIGSEGQTFRRDLNAGDITGINSLY